MSRVKDFIKRVATYAGFDTATEPRAGALLRAADRNLVYRNADDGSGYEAFAMDSPMTTQGDMIIGDASGYPARLALGASGTAPVSNGTTLVATSVVVPTIVDAKGDLIAGTAADTIARLAVGTNDYALVADSAQSTGLKYAGVVLQTLADAKGDIIAATAADTWARVAVGATDGMALMVDSAQSAGIRWATANLYVKEGAGVVYAAYANGDANDAAPVSFTTSSPDTICTASFNRARGVLFRLPRTLAVTDAYIVGTTLGSSGSMYKLGIYKASDNSQIWASSAFDTTAADWTNLTGLSFTLDANTDYYLFTITTASSATNSAATFQPGGNAGIFGSNGPFYTSTEQGYPRFVEYTVGTPGTLDATMPALAAMSTATGACLKTYLKGTAT